MRFWDTSALLAFLAEQLPGLKLESVMFGDPTVAVWWGTLIEMTSGLCRLRREGEIDDLALAALQSRAKALCSEADEVGPSEPLRDAAIRILKLHELRAADSMQLAAALSWTDYQPAEAVFVCADQRLREAARKEGFTVLPTSL